MPKPKKPSPREYYESLLDSMEMGLDRAVLAVLRFHIGLDNAVEKEPLMLALSQSGFHPKDERQVRLAIVRLRNAGIPVCSSSGEAGYFLPATFPEFMEFIGREYWGKVKTMIETATRMMDGINTVFPADVALWKRTKTFAINPETFEVEGDIEEAFAVKPETKPQQMGLFG